MIFNARGPWLMIRLFAKLQTIPPSFCSPVRSAPRGQAFISVQHHSQGQGNGKKPKAPHRCSKARSGQCSHCHAHCKSQSSQCLPCHQALFSLLPAHDLRMRFCFFPGLLFYLAREHFCSSFLPIIPPRHKGLRARAPQSWV